MNPLNKQKIPINRLNKWYDDESFAMDMEMGREWLEGDNNFTIALFRIDRQNTNYDSIYGETLQDEIRFLPPIELKVLVEIEDHGPKTYNPNGTMYYEDYGNLTFWVYQKQLEEKKVNIMMGDFVGYADKEDNIKYFKVVDDNRINSETDKTFAGYKIFYNKIVCVPTDINEFRSI